MGDNSTIKIKMLSENIDGVIDSIYITELNKVMIKIKVSDSNGGFVWKNYQITTLENLLSLNNNMVLIK